MTTRYIVPDKEERVEQDEEFADRPEFFQKVAQRIREVAKESPAISKDGHPWKGKAFIHVVAGKLGSPMHRFVPILMKLHRWGLVELTRLDLVGAFSVEAVIASEVEIVGSFGTMSTYNFIKT